MARVKKHFKLHASLANHRKTAALFADNDMLALYGRIGILAIERFADKTGDSFLVHPRELLVLTGRGRADVARRSLERLADISPISVESEGDLLRIGFPNFAEKQGFDGKNGSRSGSSPPPPPSPMKDQEGTAPERRPREGRSRSVSGGGSDGRRLIEPKHLASARSLLSIFQNLVSSERHPFVTDCEADLQWVFCAAERALRLGKAPGALFRKIIDEDQRDRISREDERRGMRRWREHEKGKQ